MNWFFIGVCCWIVFFLVNSIIGAFMSDGDMDIITFVGTTGLFMVVVLYVTYWF